MKNTNGHFCAGVGFARILFLFSLCFLSLHSYAADVDRYAEEKTLTVEMQNKRVKDVLDYIEKNSEFIFFYYNEAIDVDRKVSLSLRDKPITVILDHLFKGTGVRYEINGRQIALKKEIRQAQRNDFRKRTLQGTVMDVNDGTPLVGANVKVQGEKTGVITDMDGRFSIQIGGASCTLEFSYLGYKTQEVYITDQGIISVRMVPDDEMLGEVVVVGAGTQKKIAVTGAITSVKGSTLRIPSSSLTNNLAGQLSGIIAKTNSGEPGSSGEFYIRGINTFGGRATPLILLDGVEISTSDLNNIPPETIESFSILKDASATAIYGARGANGVMLVTTKSGEENSKARINVTYEHSFLKPVNMVEYADGVTYMQLYNEAQLSRSPTTVPKYSTEQIERTASGVNPYVYPNVDWYGLMFKDMSQSQRANVNVSGGGSRVTYYMSLQANHDSGMLDVPQNYSMNNNYNRWMYSFQNNIDYKLTSTTKLGLRMNAQIVNTKSPNTSAAVIFSSIYLNNPVEFPAIYPSDGSEYVRFGSGLRQAGQYYNNPYAGMLNTFKEDNQNKINVSLNLDQKLDFITEGLSLTALVNFNNWSQTWYTRSITPYYFSVVPGSWSPENPDEYELQQLQEGSQYISESGISRNSDLTFYFDARLNYARSFGLHNVTGMLMYMMREYRSSVLPNRNQGFSGRFTYDYGHRYLAEFNFGYNGTERIDKGDRFEFFPAVSVGWVVSSEEFWEPVLDYVDNFKIRASYGLVGSDETGTSAGAPHFLYKYDVNLSGGPSFSSGPTGSNSQTYNGPAINGYPVADASWERSRQFDIGVDLRLFNQVDITFDYFNYKRDRILMSRGSFPRILGYINAIPWSNIGKVDNKGIELSVNWSKRFNKDWTIDLRANYTYNKNKYVFKDEPNYPYVWQTETGKPMDSMRGYIADGLFADQAEIDAHATQNFGSPAMPGDIKYRDVNGDGQISEEDKVMISPYGDTPRIQYGFGVSLTWKKLDFNAFFNGSAKRTIMLVNSNGFDSDDNIHPFINASTHANTNLMQWIADSHWTEGGDNSGVAFPRLGVNPGEVNNNLQPSTFWMRNGSYLRFKTLEIGYRLPYCRIYFSGDNLAVWSPFKYWDPELAYNQYPLSRTFNIGVQFNF